MIICDAILILLMWLLCQCVCVICWKFDAEISNFIFSTPTNTHISKKCTSEWRKMKAIWLIDNEWICYWYCIWHTSHAITTVSTSIKINIYDQFKWTRRASHVNSQSASVSANNHFETYLPNQKKKKTVSKIFDITFEFYKNYFWCHWPLVRHTQFLWATKLPAKDERNSMYEKKTNIVNDSKQVEMSQWRLTNGMFVLLLARVLKIRTILTLAIFVSPKRERFHRGMKRNCWFSYRFRSLYRRLHSISFSIFACAVKLLGICA